MITHTRKNYDKRLCVTCYFGNISFKHPNPLHIMSIGFPPRHVFSIYNSALFLSGGKGTNMKQVTASAVSFYLDQKLVMTTGLAQPQF